jgi:hypothetical protein
LSRIPSSGPFRHLQSGDGSAVQKLNNGCHGDAKG